MKPTKSFVSHFVVGEDDNYECRFYCYSETPAASVEFHLFRVTVEHQPKPPTILYVLAEGPDAAIGQARCALGISEYNVDASEERKIHTSAQRVPFLIRGWGGTVFSPLSQAASAR